MIQRLLKKYAGNSDSPHQSPRCRTPLASIGNISVTILYHIFFRIRTKKIFNFITLFSNQRSNSSPRRTPQSPRINTAAEKTPASLVKTISVIILFIDSYFAINPKCMTGVIFIFIERAHLFISPTIESCGRCTSNKYN